MPQPSATAKATEDFLNSSHLTWKVLFTCGFILQELAGATLSGQEVKRLPAQQRSAAASGQGKLWRSKTTGKQYRVRIEKDRLYAEWANIPREAAQQGGYIHTECRRVGAKWIGTSKIFLPCAAGDGSVSNKCHLLMHMEIDKITSDTISGRVEDPKAGKFDCAQCKVLETAWKNFVWVPMH